MRREGDKDTMMMGEYTVAETEAVKDFLGGGDGSNQQQRRMRQGSSGNDNVKTGIPIRQQLYLQWQSGLRLVSAAATISSDNGRGRAVSATVTHSTSEAATTAMVAERAPIGIVGRKTRATLRQ